MNFDELPEFKKERKRFTRKYKSLPDDLRNFRNFISIIPLGNSKHFNTITETESGLKIIKARLFCRYLKGSSLRIIYSYIKIKEKEKVDFIEIYFKGEKENEDRERIKRYLKFLGT